MNRNNLTTWISIILPILKLYFAIDVENVFKIINFDFILYFCGVDFLDYSRINENSLEVAKIIVSIIPEESFTCKLSEISMRIWNGAIYILSLINICYKEKFIRIINNLDLTNLSRTHNDNWNLKYEIDNIIECLMIASITKAREFILMNESCIKQYTAIMVYLCPEQSIKNNLENAIPLVVFDSDNWEYIYLALDSLKRAKQEYSINYLLENKFRLIQRYSDVRALDFINRGAIDLLLLINVLDSELYFDIINSIDKQKITENWDQCGGIPQNKKGWITRRKSHFYKLIGIID